MVFILYTLHIYQLYNQLYCQLSVIPALLHSNCEHCFEVTKVTKHNWQPLNLQHACYRNKNVTLK